MSNRISPEREIALVDSVPFYVRGVTAVLKEFNYQVRTLTGLPSDILSAAKRFNSRLAIIGQVPGQDGLTLIEGFHQLALPVIVLCGQSDPIHSVIQSAQKAEGLVDRNCEPTILRGAIDAISGGKRYIDPLLAPTIVSLVRNPNGCDLPQGVPLNLRKRESECMEYVIKGLTNPEITKAMSITAKTLTNYLSSIGSALSARPGFENRGLIREKILRYAINTYAKRFGLEEDSFLKVPLSQL